ncbi:MAG: CooT family nickel-binding protein [Proteobacteria bacterium]|nr:CooT family nickel-binding protein [Pseudomonadota bacterium]
MCEASAYIIGAQDPVLVMESVDKAEPDGENIRLISIFGEQKIIRGKIHSLSLVDHKIYIEEQP